MLHLRPRSFQAEPVPPSNLGIFLRRKSSSDLTLPDYGRFVRDSGVTKNYETSSNPCGTASVQAHRDAHFPSADDCPIVDRRTDDHRTWHCEGLLQCSLGRSPPSARLLISLGPWSLKTFHPHRARDTRYGFSNPAQFICFRRLRGLRTWLIHAWIYRGQFSNLVPSTSQLARKSTASWLTSVTSRKSKTNYWLAASKASSSCSFLTFSASILPLSLKTTRLLPDR
jgi:hypothetical protein